MSPHTDTLLRVANRTLRPDDAARHADFIININQWHWHQGVALLGLHRAAEATGDPRLRDYIATWIDTRLAETNGNPPKSINTTAPLLTVALMHEQTPRPEWARVCDDFAAWCMTAAPRLPDGAFEHSCTDNKYPLQVWADTLFMGCLFLVKWGRLTDDKTLIDEALRQFSAHYRHLHDARTGLIHHGYDDFKKSHMGVLWGRGNGWFAAAAVEVLAMLGPQYPGCDELLRNFHHHIDGALGLQDPATGAWRTVMDAPETYLESTVTAALAHALNRAIALNLIDAAHAENARRAMSRTLAWIDAQGNLTHASAGTPVMPDVAGYAGIPFAVTAFSQGLAMLALSNTPL